jgi:hypothetical protein
MSLKKKFEIRYARTCKAKTYLGSGILDNGGSVYMSSKCWPPYIVSLDTADARNGLSTTWPAWAAHGLDATTRRGSRVEMVCGSSRWQRATHAH